jgi:hypothetical protein
MTKEKKQRACTICGSDHAVKGRNGIDYCNKHYIQICKHGHILDRTIFDPNIFIEHPEEDYAEIVMFDDDCKECARALVSMDKLELVKTKKWSYNPTLNMAVTDGGNTYLHRFITECPPGMTVDHRNGTESRLDNRNTNLRVCTQAQNNMNKLERSDNTSGFRGVSLNKKLGKYEAYIHVGGKKLILGYFKELTDAINERCKAEIKYYGEFSPIFRDTNNNQEDK